MKELWILRHAHAEPTAESGRDFDRGLSSRGLSEADSVRSHLVGLGLGENWAVRVSPAARTLQTAERALRGLDLPDPEADAAIWEATPGELLEVARSGLEIADSLMLIGHNPGLEGLVTWLGGRAIRLPPAGLVLLDCDPELAPGRSRIRHQFTPD